MKSTNDNYLNYLVAALDDYGKEFLENFRERIIKDSLDILLLARLKDVTMSGYDAIAYFRNKFHVFLSCGTLYSSLYALERRGLVQGKWESRKRVYSLSENGRRVEEIALFLSEKIQELLLELSNIIRTR